MAQWLRAYIALVERVSEFNSQHPWEVVSKVFLTPEDLTYDLLRHLHSCTPNPSPRTHIANTKIKREGGFCKAEHRKGCRASPRHCCRRVVTFFTLNTRDYSCVQTHILSWQGCVFGKCIITPFLSCQELHRWCNRNLVIIGIYDTA